MLVQKLGNAQLGAHAIGAGNQHRLLHSGNGQAKAAAETAYIVQAAFVFGPGNVLLHQFHGLVAGSDVYTGSGVAGRLRVFMIHVKISFLTVASFSDFQMFGYLLPPSVSASPEGMA